MIKKIVNYLDYIFYSFLISKIPFKPGKILRYHYFKIKHGKKLGKNVNISHNVNISRNVIIGDNVTITDSCRLGYHLGGKIIISDDVLIGHEVLFINNIHNYKNLSMRVQDQGYLPFKDIFIGRGAWIGARVIIMPGVNIGAHAVIGAGSIVTKDIPEKSVAVGIPAKVIKSIFD